MALPEPPQSSTSSSTPGATCTMRTLCGVLSTHAAGLKSDARATGTTRASSADTQSKNSRHDCIVVTGILLMNGVKRSILRRCTAYGKRRGLAEAP
jgi:hypothetical protein